MKKYSIIFLILFVLFAAAALKVHQNFPLNHFRNELWCDKAGYNVYLPATFLYHFNSDLFPKEIAKTTGGGFIQDTLHQKIYTKYPYGVSLLQSPFWLAAHLCSKEKTGYSLYYTKSVDVSAAFYLTAGCYLLFLIFSFYTTKKNAFIATMVALSCTNLLYYGVFEPGMSHVYSFFSISLLVWSLLKIQQSLEPSETRKRQGYYILLASSIALCIIIRPVNAIVWLPALLLLGIGTRKQLIARLRLLTRLRFLIPLFVMLLLLISPQLLYYEYLKNALIINSYEFESFSYLYSPRIAELLFSPNNGWMLFTPLALLLPAAIFYYFRKNIWTGLLLLFIFAADIAIYSTWWSVDLGCGYGHRPFVEMIPVIAVPIFLWLKRTKLKPVLYIPLIGLLMIMNLKLMYSFSGCYNGNGYWDWAFFTDLLLK